MLSGLPQKCTGSPPDPPLASQEANQITRQLLEALRFLHCDQKIVHRDLKPENILMVKVPSPSPGYNPLRYLCVFFAY